MKHLKSILVAALVLLVTGVTNAQDKNNPWAIEVGVNAVDTFPTGLRDGQTGKDPLNGNLFDEYFNVEDHYNVLPSVSRVAVGYYLGDGFTMGAVGTVNKIEKIGRVEVESMTYYGFDGEIKYSFREMLGNGWVDPSIGIGGGYTWLGDARFGTAFDTNYARHDKWVITHITNFQPELFEDISAQKEVIDAIESTKYDLIISTPFSRCQMHVEVAEFFRNIKSKYHISIYILDILFPSIGTHEVELNTRDGFTYITDFSTNYFENCIELPLLGVLNFDTICMHFINGECNSKNTFISTFYDEYVDILLK